MGPNILPELFAILLSFRLNPVANIGDIHQAFLLLQLDPKDRDLTRFFLYRVTRDPKGNYNTTDELICYRFTRLPFALTCNHFCFRRQCGNLLPYTRIAFPRRKLLLIAVDLWIIW
jgi:hypothetical protein